MATSLSEIGSNENLEWTRKGALAYEALYLNTSCGETITWRIFFHQGVVFVAVKTYKKKGRFLTEPATVKCSPARARGFRS